jgi:peroxiredoxin Q/BCP
MEKVVLPLIMGLGLLLTGVVSYHARAEEMEMTVGTAAPDFSLVDQNGSTRTLSGLRNHWVVLYFYPKDDTPGCTKEACQFRDDYSVLKQLGVEILGVSLGSAESHDKFSKKFSLPFPLLADTEGSVAKQYGALWKFGPIRFARRQTFIIDPQGRIARVYRKVDPAAHSQEVIEAIKLLQQSGH